MHSIICSIITMSDKHILIKDFPLSPSINKCYRNLPRGGRCSTKDLLDYKESCRIWAIKNKNIIESAKYLLNGEWKDRILRLDAYFIFKRERLYCKNGKPKKNDVGNYLKAFEDCLYKELGIDDSFNFGIYLEKSEGQTEGIIVFISVISPLTAIEIMQNFSEQAPESSEKIQ